MEELYNVNYEKTVLSSFIFEPTSFDKFKNNLTEESFYLPSHKNIFKTLISLDDSNLPLTEDFIVKLMKKENTFDENILINILSTTPINSIENYIVEIQNKHKIRKIDELNLKLKHGKIDFSLFKIHLEKIENLYKKEQQKEDSFSVDFERLTPFLGGLVKDLMKINNYPPTMVLVTVLSSMAGIIGARAKITNNTNITVFPVIWSMIIAPSSLSAKSTLFKFTKKCIFDNLQTELFDKFDSDTIQYKEDLKKFNALSRDEKAQEVEPEKPHPKLLIFANDSTPEAKLISLNRNSNGGVVYFDEMKAELEKSNNNPSYKALKTSLFDGETYHKELVKDGGTTFILRNPVLSEVGLITEQWLLESVQKNDIASGFMARYLFSYNKRADFKPLQIQENILNCTKYSKVGRFIIDMFGIDAKETILFRLSNEAEVYYRDWFNDFSKTAYATETDEEITASYRLSTYVLKFALIIHIFNNANQLIDIVQSNMLKVDLDTLKASIYLLEIFQEENHKILSLFEKNQKLNFKIDDVTVKLQKKIRATEEQRISKTLATNGIRGLTAKKMNELLDLGLFRVEKIDRKTYILEN